MHIRADRRRACGNEGRFSMFSAIERARGAGARLTVILEIL
jgi:hypothetical protein